jgi:polysaccharide export outer membrane protein
VSSCLVTSFLVGTLAAPAPNYAQNPQEPAGQVLPVPADVNLDTQQKANQRLTELARSARAPLQDYIVGRGDIISVEVFDVPELTREARVSQTGTIGIPLVPVRPYVVGLTEMQVQQKISEILEANGLVSHPQVMVSVKEKRSKPIAIVGAVAHPMVYQADRPVTLIEVLAEAGGIANDAGDTVIITRPDSLGATKTEPPEIGPEDPVPATNPSLGENAITMPPKQDAQASKPATSADGSASGQGQLETASNPSQQPVTSATPPAVGAPNAAPLPTTITVNLSEILERGDTQNNIPLQAGDVVTVPHAGVVYALGAVARPGGFVATNDRSQLSTLKVLALAGGATAVAKKNHAVIIRKDAAGKQLEIPVDLTKIVKRETEDIRLMPSDILYVPTSGAKSALIRATEIAAVAGTAIFIYRVGQH